MLMIKKFKAPISLVLIFAVILHFSSFPDANAAFAPDFEIHSEGVYMVNLDTDTAVYAKNENKRFYPASLTKMMTAIVVLENCSDLNASVRVGEDAFEEFLSGDPNKEGASTAGIEPGQENLTYLDCLYALMVSSACEAGNILAINLCGSVGAFTELMNGTAEELGCRDTHFSNAHGLWEADNYSTPYDMYLIARYGRERVSGFAEICDTRTYSLPANTANPEGYDRDTVNPLLNPKSEYYLDYAHGVKTGSMDYYYDEYGNTCEGMKCMVSTASRDGLSYMLVTMEAPFFGEDGERASYSADDHRKLYEWAYDSLEYRTVVEEGQVFAAVKVQDGPQTVNLELAAAGGFSAIVPKQSYIGDCIGLTANTYADVVSAPVSRGEILGSLEVIYMGETAAVIDLAASRSVGADPSGSAETLFDSVPADIWIIYAVTFLTVCLIVTK